MNIVCCFQAPKGGAKTQNDRFPSKTSLHLKKVCYKVFCVNTVSDKVVSIHWPLSIRAKNG